MDTLLEQLGFSPDSELPPDLAAMLEQLQMTGQLQMVAGGVDASNSGTPAASGSGRGSSGASGKDRNAWRLIGIDPTNEHIDAHLPDMFRDAGEQLSSFHSHAPLMGSVTGLSPIYGISGERLGQGYCDLSHMGLGLRHRGGLIQLPEIYTDIYQAVSVCLQRRVYLCRCSHACLSACFHVNIFRIVCSSTAAVISTLTRTLTLTRTPNCYLHSCY
jgi:hypothetical protein